MTYTFFLADMTNKQFDQLMKHIESLVTGGAAVNVQIINIESIAKPTFEGTYRAMARFQEPIDESLIEKAHRLRCDKIPWKYIGRVLYREESGQEIEETDLPAYVDRLKKQHRREYPEFYRPGK